MLISMIFSKFGVSEDRMESHENKENCVAQFLPQDAILALINSEITALQSTFHLTADQCLILLMRFKWSTKSLWESLGSNPENFLINHGVLPKQPTDQSAEPLECSVCCSDEVLFSLTCGHMACRDCWEAYLTGKLEEGKCLIECMDPECKLVVDKNFIENFDATLLASYQSLLANDYVQVTPTLSKCPGPQCPLYFQSSFSLPQTVHCSCGTSFCSSCESTPHSPSTCRQWQLWQKKCDTLAPGKSSMDQVSQEWFLQNTKECPKCLTSIQKNGGCPIIYCTSSKCRLVFCWKCRQAFRHHNLFQCDKSDLEAERVRMHNRSDSQRFQACHAKLTEQKDKLELDTKLFEEVVAKQRTPIDARFVREMRNSILKSQHGLMHSCILEYYLARGWYAGQLKKQQEQLQKAMTNLSNEFIECSLSRTPILKNFHLLEQQRKQFLEFCFNGASYEDLDGRSHSDSLIWNHNLQSNMLELFVIAYMTTSVLAAMMIYYHRFC